MTSALCERRYAPSASALTDMLRFKTITLEDKHWVDEIVFSEGSHSADYNFGNVYIWDKLYKQLVCRFEGRMLTKLRYEGKPSFVFPIGTGPLRPAIEELRQFSNDRGSPFRMHGVTEAHKAQLEAEYPGCFIFEEEEDRADYIYLAEKLATYSGKALHSKKNHCNRFEAENQWQFVPITRDIIPLCLDMLDVWSEDNAQRLEDSIIHEHDAIIRAFAVYEKLGLDGGALFAGGRLVGFSIGELISENCFNVHFEKAEGSLRGAYPMVCREFVRMLMEKYPALEYINREDDMGIEALRRSKQSYKPEYLLKKYIARWKYESLENKRILCG